MFLNQYQKAGWLDGVTTTYGNLPFYHHLLHFLCYNSNNLTFHQLQSAEAMKSAMGIQELLKAKLLLIIDRFAKCFVHRVSSFCPQ